MKNKKIRTEESLEKFRTDLSEYSFMLEQEYKEIIFENLSEEEKNKMNTLIDEIEVADLEE